MMFRLGKAIRQADPPCAACSTAHMHCKLVRHWYSSSTMSSLLFCSWNTRFQFVLIETKTKTRKFDEITSLSTSK